MDLLALAQQRFQQLAAGLAAPMTEATSEAVERWLRDQVCAATEPLMRGERFRAWARWSPDRLGPGSTSPQRPLVERVDRALVEAARRTLEAARGLGLVPPPDGGRGPLSGLASLGWLAGRPWFDLACPEEYFTADRGLHLRTGCPDRHAELVARDDVRVPLGDYVARAMFARIGYFAGKIDEAFGPCLDVRYSGGAEREAAHAVAGRMFAAKVELDEAVVALRRACHRGAEPRLRDACSTLVQVYAAYGPDPEAALDWLGCPPSWASVGGSMLRVVVRPPGERVQVAHDGRGGYRVVGRERARLCRPDVAHGVAAALAVVAELYRRPVEADSLIDWLSQERRLVLVDRRPRLAFWEGGPVVADWDRNAVLWDLLWKLARRARRGLPVHREELIPPGAATGAAKHRRSRLSKSIPAGLDACIEDVRPGGYRLTLGREEIGLLELDHDEQLIEAGPEVGPALI